MQRLQTEKLEQLLFTTTKPGEQPNRCAVVIDKKHAVTYKHGTMHSQLKHGEELLLYSVKSPEIAIKVCLNCVEIH